MSTRVVALLALLLCAGALAAQEITHSVQATTGGTLASGNLRLSWTAGEPVAGTTSANGVVLKSGMQALFLPPPGAVPGRIFGDGFESPSP